ncbi:MAG: nicotinamide mononucleotide transporter family protein, partial [Schleiferiaceae bacterium]|nr:nicotinamide mononucleotide transporter family protein [Schleiferiaceae bacterium]
MINQRIWAWPMGLMGCLAAAVMFESSQLHAEAFLNVLYAALAIYGWVTWQGNNQAMMVVHRAQRRVWWGLAAIIMTLALGWAMKTQTSNPLPFVDAGIFSLSVI